MCISSHPSAVRSPFTPRSGPVPAGRSRSTWVHLLEPALRDGVLEGRGRDAAAAPQEAVAAAAVLLAAVPGGRRLAAPVHPPCAPTTTPTSQTRLHIGVTQGRVQGKHPNDESEAAAHVHISLHACPRILPTAFAVCMSPVLDGPHPNVKTLFASFIQPRLSRSLLSELTISSQKRLELRNRARWGGGGKGTNFPARKCP